MVVMNEKKGSGVFISIVSERNYQLNYWFVAKNDIIMVNYIIINLVLHLQNFTTLN